MKYKHYMDVNVKILLDVMLLSIQYDMILILYNINYIGRCN